MTPQKLHTPGRTSLMKYEFTDSIVSLSGSSHIQVPALKSKKYTRVPIPNRKVICKRYPLVKKNLIFFMKTYWEYQTYFRIGPLPISEMFYRNKVYGILCLILLCLDNFCLIAYSLYHNFINCVLWFSLSLSNVLCVRERGYRFFYFFPVLYSIERKKELKAGS